MLYHTVAQVSRLDQTKTIKHFSHFPKMPSIFMEKLSLTWLACKHFPVGFLWKQVKVFACVCVCACMCVCACVWEEKVLSSDWKLFLGKPQVKTTVTEHT